MKGKLRVICKHSLLIKFKYTFSAKYTCLGYQIYVHALTSLGVGVADCYAPFHQHYEYLGTPVCYLADCYAPPHLHYNYLGSPMCILLIAMLFFIYTMII